MMLRKSFPHMFYAYILRCADGTLYSGCTNDLESRLHAHNNLKSGAHYTKIRRPVVLVHLEKFRSLAKARAREAEVKRMTREEKHELILVKKAPKKRSAKKKSATKSPARMRSSDPIKKGQ